MLKWFSKKKIEVELDPLDFSVLKTDIHSHFIPGIDDIGSGLTKINKSTPNWFKKYGKVRKNCRSI